MTLNDYVKKDEDVKVDGDVKAYNVNVVDDKLLVDLKLRMI